VVHHDPERDLGVRPKRRARVEPHHAGLPRAVDQHDCVKPTRRLEESIEVICRHIDRIEEIAGPGHVGLGTDLDGFIKPSTAGLETAADLARLRDPLGARYRDEAKVDAFLYGSARRVVERALAAR
jgi:microsomal dipeptidase-like Zn-dependent dipeptidase